MPLNMYVLTVSKLPVSVILPGLGSVVAGVCADAWTAQPSPRTTNATRFTVILIALSLTPWFV
jgi:hypothetical protein